MNTALLITKRLVSLGVEKPSPALVGELEKELTPKVEALVVSTLTPRLAARAFAATLTAGKGFLGVGKAPLNK